VCRKTAGFAHDALLDVEVVEVGEFFERANYWERSLAMALVNGDWPWSGNAAYEDCARAQNNRSLEKFRLGWM